MARILSTPTIVSVTSNALPSWIPAPGQFNNVYRSDNGQIHYADAINPDTYMADGSPQVYSGSPFAGRQAGFYSMWNSQAGGAYAKDLGQYGSILLFAGGHFTYGGSGVPRFDFATGKWEMYVYPPYCNYEKEVINGTVAALTGTVQLTNYPNNEDANQHVSESGNYYKTMDHVQIPGGGDALGDGITVWTPYPIHSNIGICGLPADAGGGTLGSLIVHGHDQTGIRVLLAKYQIFRLDLETKVWSASLVGDLLSSEHSFPALEYDSTRKLMWVIPVSGRPIAFNYLTAPYPARHRITGPSLNFTGGYVANACYMPTRDIMVYFLASSTGYQAFQDPIDPASAASYRYPRIYAFSLAGYTFNQANFNPSPFELHVSPTSEYYLDQISQGLDTGWPGYRTGSALVSGESTWLGASDNGNLMQGGCWGPRMIGDPAHADPNKVRGINDRLEYCDYEDCLLYVERQSGTDNGTTRANQTQIKLWKLHPPAIGQEVSGTWTWDLEIINPAAGSGGAGFFNMNEMPAWGGKTKYIPALKCIYYTDRPGTPVQVIRSVDWI